MTAALILPIVQNVIDITDGDQLALVTVLDVIISATEALGVLQDAIQMIIFSSTIHTNTVTNASTVRMDAVVAKTQPSAHLVITETGGIYVNTVVTVVAATVTLLLAVVKNVYLHITLYKWILATNANRAQLDVNNV